MYEEESTLFSVSVFLPLLDCMTSPRPLLAPSLILGGTYFPSCFPPAAGAAGVGAAPGVSTSGFFLSPSRVSLKKDENTLYCIFFSYKVGFISFQNNL